MNKKLQQLRKKDFNELDSTRVYLQGKMIEQITDTKDKNNLIALYNDKLKKYRRRGVITEKNLER